MHRWGSTVVAVVELRGENWRDHFGAVCLLSALCLQYQVPGTCTGMYAHMHMCDGYGRTTVYLVLALWSCWILRRPRTTLESSCFDGIRYGTRNLTKI